MEIIKYEFFQNALIATIIFSVIFPLLSFFVVNKKMNFLSVGISHAAFTGVAFSLFIGINVLYGALLWALIFAITIYYINKNLSDTESSVGFMFSFTMALGIIFINLKKGYTPDIFGYLFGNILMLTKNDVILLSIFGVFFIILFYKFFKAFLYASFDPIYSSLIKIPVNTLNYAFVIILSVMIVLSVKLAGIVLISALLTLPALIFSNIFDRYSKILAFSVIFSLIINVFCLFLSYYFNLPSGPTIVVINGIFYFISVIYAKRRKNENT